MLPSTGYFNGINCPFYENGLCDRPYCHFRHVKKDPQIANDGIESGAILQKLVSAAVQKVLQHREVSALGSSVQQAAIDKDVNIAPTTTKVTYNPTPISELNKIHSADAENGEDINEQRRKHIPVPYTPRKPTSLPIKRPVDTNGSKPFIYIPPAVKYTPGSAENVPTDKYTPPGAVESKDKYLPGSEKELQEYTPNSKQESPTKRNYVPSSEKTVNKNKLLEYRPIKVSAASSKPPLTYQPTPRSLAPCFSSDEEEPDSKKRKVSTDLNGLDDLGAEFDILDQILDEEKHGNKEKVATVTEDSKSKKKDNEHSKRDSKTKKDDTADKKKDSKNEKDSEKVKDDSKKSKHSSSHRQSNGDASKKEKSDPSKSKKSHHKSKSNDKEKSSDEKKEIKDKDKNKHTDKKSSHKSSSKDRSRDKEKERKEKDKHGSEKKKHSSRSSHSPKHSKHSSSKSSEKHSKSSSNRESKTKDKHKEKSHKSKDKDKNKYDIDSDHQYIEQNGTDEETDLSDADEETIAEQCKKFFEEYVPTDKCQEPEETSKLEESIEDEYIPTKKRISRTVDKNIKVIPKPSLKPDFKVSAAQAMADRLAKVREFHNSRNQIPTTTTSSNESIVRNDVPKVNIPVTGSSKIRIAHVPYASTLLNAKKTISPAQIQSKNKDEPSTSSTISQTVKKGSQRVAHVPSDKFIDRPGVLEPLASRIPANIRSTYLNMMIDECLKLYLSVTDAYARAQNEELNTSKKCSTAQIYKNSAVMTISRLRRELQESNGVKKSSDSSANTQSNSLGTWSIEGRNKKINDQSKEFVGARFYENIKKWVLTEDQLKENGFPRPHESGEKGRATIYAQNKQKPPKGYIRTCCRCKKEYTVNKKGFAAVREECIYHPNNKYRVRGEARYQCCSQDATSDGCCIAPCHVYEYVDYDNLRGFVRTLPPEETKDDYGVYSLDCEMCYTTHGLDLTRVTVINSACKVVYETLIKPLHPIVDYNTRYSGITEEQMSKVRTTLLEVQATLLAMFNSKTILVGHSLESDFKALKLIHDTVIDTSVLFPHKMGPPFKRALRNLSSEHLKKIIQNSVEGHDSAEDALVCMELIHYKLKEDLKTR